MYTSGAFSENRAGSTSPWKWVSLWRDTECVDMSPCAVSEFVSGQSWVYSSMDMAALAAFLLSPEAAWITGQILGVDGGRSSLRVKG